jgi:hypothetical protein
LQMDRQRNVLKEFPSMAEAEREGFVRNCIAKVCTGKARHHKGYLWSFNSAV